MLAGLFQAAAEYSAEREAIVSSSQLRDQIAQMPKISDPYKNLGKLGTIRVIAEIKRASPSRGHLAQISDPAAMARDYEQAGASAISVLTERTGFRGSMEDLKAVTDVVSIPVLRKDFISNEYQILDARASGATLVLLILAHLNGKDFLRLHDLAHDLGMGVLVECHNESELDTAAEAEAKLIGINTRNLETFKTDIGLFERLAGALPDKAIKVAESAVKSSADVASYRAAGADVVLVGEALVTGEHKSLIRQFTSIS